jgi:hypothetical protein
VYPHFVHSGRPFFLWAGTGERLLRRANGSRIITLPGTEKTIRGFSGVSLLLVDGYHRVAASRRLGLETVEAEVHTGTRHDALRYAAKVGAAQRGISPEEATSYIERHGRDCGTSES